MNAHGNRVGPHALICVGEVLEPEQADRIFRLAGLGRYRAAPPADMVDEREVAALHAALRASVPDDTYEGVVRQAGGRIGNYLLANRIPVFAQRILKLLPTALAARMLTAAIARHAWTFAGTGRFSVQRGDVLQLSIADCPLCRGAVATSPICGTYAATMERLFQRLVHPQTTVRESACVAAGAAACVFEVALPKTSMTFRRSIRHTAIRAN